MIIKILKKIQQGVTPPVFQGMLFREYINQIFFRKKIRHLVHYENNFYKRHAFINRAVSKFKNCKYLEIGVYENDVFNAIPLKMENKFGVDPERGGNFRMTSDEFFEKNKHLKFDVIYIDGLHTYLQCQRDCTNALKSLNKNGIILFHDMLPRSYFEEHIPIKQSSWTGDVWKVAVEILNSKGLDFKICNIDMGIGILKSKDHWEYIKSSEVEKMNFKDYLDLRNKFPLVNSEEALDFIDQN